MNNLNLCLDHKQEWKQSHYASHNCDHCKLQKEIESLKEANKVLRGKLEESVNILKDGCLVYDQFVPSGSSSFRSDAQWFIDSMAKADEIIGEKK